MVKNNRLRLAYNVESIQYGVIEIDGQWQAFEIR